MNVRAAGIRADWAARIDDHLRPIGEHLQAANIDEGVRSDVLTELKSHLTERTMNLEAEGSPDPLAEALDALGDTSDIARQFAAVANAHAAARSFSPFRLLAAAWSLVQICGKGLHLVAVAVAGYALALGAVFAATMKSVNPGQVGFWIGESGIVWGIPADGKIAREVAGSWFIPLSAWLAVFAVVGTALLLRKQMQRFAAHRVLRQNPVA